MCVEVLMNIDTTFKEMRLIEVSAVLEDRAPIFCTFSAINCTDINDGDQVPYMILCFSNHRNCK